MTFIGERYTFERMDPERRREIASEGGKRAHQLGRAYTWNSETARQAALKSAASRKAKKQGK
jgi:general stress protein YciG